MWFRTFFSLLKTSNKQHFRLCNDNTYTKFVEKSFMHETKNNNMGCSTSKITLKRDSSSSASSPRDDEIEAVLCKADEIKENEMKGFNVQDIGKVLLVKQNGKLHAVGGKCTHYGAPLETGALSQGRVRCPWHGACFSLETGDIEDFPGLDSLPCYKVESKNDEITIRARRTDLATSKRSKVTTTPASKTSSHFVVVGGGPAAAKCVETLRQEGYAGKITVIARENALPYDRIKLSKTMDVEVQKLQLRDDQFYKNLGINFTFGLEAVQINTKENSITLSNREVVKYTKAFIATGSTPLKAQIPGSNLENVVTLREVEDAHRIHKLLNADVEVVVLGASFIGMEAACYMQSKVKKVTLVGRDSVPFKKVLGPEIGESVQKLFETKGIVFKMQTNIVECVGDEQSKVKEVKLANGEILRADIVVMGVGSSLNTQFLKESDVHLLPNGAIDVNRFMQTNVPNVYAGGDVANAFLYPSNQKAVIGHYGLAHYHGHIAGMNMMEKNFESKAVPFFWTMFFGKGIRYSGHGQYNHILYSGDVNEFKFVAYYMQDDNVVAVSTCGNDPIAAQFAECLSSGKQLKRADLGDDLMQWKRIMLK